MVNGLRPAAARIFGCPFNVPREWRPYSLDAGNGQMKAGTGFPTNISGGLFTITVDGTHDDFYGWVWMPDDVWAPSWVEWRSNDYCIGWHLLRRMHFRFSSGLHYSRHWRAPEHYWSFVRYERFTRIFSTLIS